MFFTSILAGPVRDMARLLIEIDIEMSGLGARLDSDLGRAAFDPDPDRGVFDGTGDKPVFYDDFMENMLRIVGWTGVSLGYRFEDFSLSILASRPGDHYVNCFVDVGLKSLAGLIAQDRVASYYQGIEALARACRAEAGFGGPDLPFRPVTPAAAIEAVFSGPAASGHPGVFGLVSTVSMSAKDMEKRKSDRFDLDEWASGYWFLERRDFRDSYGRI